jgi:hypothetical protein
MIARRLNLALVLVLTVQWLTGMSLVRAQTSSPVPSGTPTEHPGSPISLGVHDTNLSLTGCASPNAFVQIFDDNSPVGTVIAGNDGRFSKNVIFDNGSAGLHNIKLYYDDATGRTSSIVTKNIALTPQSETKLDVLLPTTVEHEPEPVRIGDYLIFRGTTCPFALVNVVVNNNHTLAAKADERGNWYVIADTQNYYVGGHVYEALSDLDGQTSQRTSKYIFATVGEGFGTGSQRPVLTTPTIIEPQDLFLSSTRYITFRGTAPTNAQLEIYVDDTLQGSIFTNPIGEWTFNLTMLQPQHNVKVRACYEGACSEFSNIVRVRFAGELASCSLRFTLNNYRYYDVGPNRGVDLSIDSLYGVPDYDVLIDWGDATVEHLNLINNEPVKFHHVFKLGGQYNGTITIEDSTGCSQTHYFSTHVGARDPLPWWLLITIPLGGFLIYAVSRLVSIYRIRTGLTMPVIPWLNVLWPKPTHASHRPKRPQKQRGWYKE